MDKEKFANRLKALRQDNGISTRKLAAAIGLKSHGAISQFEKGTSLPAMDTLVKLAAFFNVTLDYLVGISDIPRPFEDNVNPAAPKPTAEHPKHLKKSTPPMQDDHSSQIIQTELKHHTEELIAGLDEESLLELQRFLRYLHARQTLDKDDETSCGLDISVNHKQAKTN